MGGGNGEKEWGRMGSEGRNGVRGIIVILWKEKAGGGMEGWMQKKTERRKIKKKI